jgi:hypothetical protein
LPGRNRKIAARRRTLGDWASASTAVAAIAAVVVVGATVFVQNASSDEVSQAADSLRRQEAELSNRITVLETSLGLYEAESAEVGEFADGAGSALIQLEGRSDEDARLATVGALAVLREALDTQEPLERPVEYRRMPTPPVELADVAAQLDAVHVASERVEEAIDIARSSRVGLAQNESTFVASWTTLGASLPATAALIASENGQAGEAYRANVVAGAAAIVAAQERGDNGLTEIATYSQAVDTLRVENQRVIDAGAVKPPPVRRWTSPAPNVPAPADPAPAPADPAPAPADPVPVPTDPAPIPTDPAPAPAPTVPAPAP